MNIAYVRVSSQEQNEARQKEALEKHGIEKWYEEKVSGKNTDRPELQAMLDFARQGDTIYIHDFSRLARSTKDLLGIIEFLNEKGVRLFSNKENIDTNSANGRMLVTILGAIYQFERENLLDRQREGIAIAKREGKYQGRKAMVIDEDKWNYYYDRYMQHKINKTQLAKALNISRPTLDKLLNKVG